MDNITSTPHIPYLKYSVPEPTIKRSPEIDDLKKATEPQAVSGTMVKGPNDPEPWKGIELF